MGGWLLMVLLNNAFIRHLNRFKIESRSVKDCTELTEVIKRNKNFFYCEDKFLVSRYLSNKELDKIIGILFDKRIHKVLMVRKNSSKVSKLEEVYSLIAMREKYLSSLTSSEERIFLNEARRTGEVLFSF